MLDPRELRDVAARFGVTEDQVQRDHLISHALAVLPGLAPDVVFFGGTALARTYLPDARLSEDVDLYARGRGGVVRVLTDGLPKALRREYPGVRWDPPLDRVREPEPALLVPRTGHPVRIQVLGGEGYTPWPTERRAIDVRYSDVPPVELVVPTRAAFVGMKAAAWLDRRAARDLYDLWALARAGAIDEAAAAAFQMGVGWWPRSRDLVRSSAADAWEPALAHQTADLPTEQEALHVVEAAFRALDRS